MDSMGNFTALLSIMLAMASLQEVTCHGEQPLSRIAIHKTVLASDIHASIRATPSVLGTNGENKEWVVLEYNISNPSVDDWIGVFSPGNFSASSCFPENPKTSLPLLCTAPIKYQYANYSTPRYKDTGKGSLKLQLINQRSNFSFALFSGGLLNPKLVAVSNIVAFANPNGPVYPRLAQGKTWNEMTVTWTSGYDFSEAEPFVEWGPKGGQQGSSPAGILTFDRSSMCGIPTSWATDSLMAHISGVRCINLNHLRILVKNLYNVLSFLGTWERFKSLTRYS